jgi:hypothetical protein
MIIRKQIRKYTHRSDEDRFVYIDEDITKGTKEFKLMGFSRTEVKLLYEISFLSSKC